MQAPDSTEDPSSSTLDASLRGLSASKVERLRRVHRKRKALVPLLLLGPALLVLVLDMILRGSRFSDFTGGEWSSYLGSIVKGMILWAVLLFAAAGRSGVGAWVARGGFLFFFTVAFGGQAYFFQQYSAYLNSDVSRFATDFRESVLNQLTADAGNYLSFKGPAFVVALMLVVAASAIVRPPRRSARVAACLAPLVVVASFLLPTEYRHRQASSPDILYMHAMGAMLETQLGLSKESHQLRPRSRASRLVAPIEPRPERPRNVVFVILESVRQDATCNEYDPACRRTEATNRVFPARYPLSQLRALDSSTAISMAVLWAGIGPHESREVLHTWPLVFDYAKAAGYRTGYFTSQNLMFGNMRLWLQNLGVDVMLTGNDVDPTSDIDLGAPEDQFAARAVSDLEHLDEPFFLTIQLSNGHYPYLVQEEGPKPFRPSSTSKAPDDNEHFFNHYQNAIHQQDRHLARLLRAIRERSGGDRTVIVYTSDHGEAFREHNQMGHTFSLFDEEILVPAWIDAPPGTLSDQEEANLRAKKDAFSFHPDLTVTVLDLLGVWDAPQLDPFREKILGVSLLRPELNDRPMPMSNCAAVWSCAFENWGYMRKEMKLEARAWDTRYNCWDVRLDPAESVNLGADACGDLKDLAQQTFGRLPGKD